MSVDGISTGGMIPDYLLPAVVLLLVVCWAYAQRWLNLLKYKRLPPGPYCPPFLGYLPMFDRNTAHIKLTSLAKKYGNVFGIYVGRKYVVILDDMRALKESYNREEFSQRPENFLVIPGGHPFMSGLNGAIWKDHRRFLVSSFRQLGVGNKDHQDMVMGELSEVLASLTKSEGKDVNLNDELELAVNNVIFHLVYGKRFELEHPIIHLLSKYNDCILQYVAHRTLALFFPVLGKIVGLTPQIRGLSETYARFHDLVRKEIAEHKASLNPSDPRDLLDLAMLWLNETDNQFVYTRESVLLGLGNGLPFVGTETIRLSLVWFLLLVAQYPEVQRKCQEEIDSVLGPDCEPRFSQIPQLPHTEATLWETMRFRNMMNFNLIRCTMKDATLMDFDIPQGSLILHNMYSHFRHPEHFPRPEEFDPTRFLAKDGRTVYVPEHFVPFSYGKRYCLGEKIATNTMLMFVTSLLQRFDILPPEGGVCLDAKVVVFNVPVRPYARFRCRR